MPSFTVSPSNIDALATFVSKMKSRLIIMQAAPEADNYVHVVSESKTIPTRGTCMRITIKALTDGSGAVSVYRLELRRAIAVAIKVGAGVTITEQAVLVGGVRIPMSTPRGYVDVEERDPIEFPDPDGVEIETGTMDMLAALRAVSVAASADQARINLYAVRWTGDALAAACGHRLHRAAIETKNLEREILIPRDVADVLLWAASGQSRIKTDCPCCGASRRALREPLIRGEYDSAAWRIRAGGLDFMSKHASVRFPPLENVIPKGREDSRVFTVNKAEAIDSLRLAGAGSDSSNNAIKISAIADENGYKVSAAPQTPDGFDHDAAQVIGRAVGPFNAFVVSARYMTDAVVSMDDGAEIMVSNTGELDPVVIETAKRLAVVMPMRV